MAGNGKLATVFGGSGFIGRHIVWQLARRGYRVRAAVRRPDLAGYLQPMGVVGQVHAVQANLRYPDSVARAVSEADVVVNAVGIMMPSGAQSFAAVQAQGARAVAAAAKAAGCAQLIHLSAVGADVNSKSNYARTKGEGERDVVAEFPGAVILRPSLVFGPEDEFFNRFADLARFTPVLPVIGGGRTKFQPVYVGDIASAIGNIAEGTVAATGRIYELGGPEVLTMRKLMQDTVEYAGRRRALISLPFWLAKLKALLMAPLPNALRPFTLDQVRLLQLDNVVSALAKQEGRTLEALGISQPASVAAIVPAYLERFKPRGQFAHYRV